MLNFIISAAVVFILFFMAFQDFKFRAISWYAFPLLGVLLVFSNEAFSVNDAGFNTAFVALNLLLVTLIFSLRERRFVNVFDHHLGLGDVLLLLCITIYFPFLLFFIFYLISLVLIVIGVGFYKIWNRRINFTVPLAGLQSLMLIPIVVLCWTFDLRLNELSENLIYLLS